MRFPVHPEPSPTSAPQRARARGFSLVELSVVVAILSVVAVFGLEGAATLVTKTNGQVTKTKMVQVDEAIRQFFRVYGRLPCPADRALGPTDTNYGTELCAASGGMISVTTTPGNGVWMGAVPFRALNIPMNLSIDGFGSKFNYAVTKNLTVAGGTVHATTAVLDRFGSHDSDTATVCTSGSCPMTGVDPADLGMGGIEIRSGILEQPCATTNCQLIANPTYATTNTTPNGAAYILFSSGADRRGAVSARGVALANCVVASATDGYKIDAQNCANTGTGAILNSVSTPANASVVGSIPANVFYDARFNNGLTLKNYFDDYVIWRPRSQL